MQHIAPGRSSGILLPVASLPSRHGIGSFGKAANDWVDFLHGAGQRYWQVLPLGPTGFGDSPYQSFSAFAGNPYFVDLDLLCEQGLLSPAECEAVDWGSGPIDYCALFTHRETLLRRAHARFTDRAALEAFRAANGRWVEDYALFMAVKAENGLRPWWEWPRPIRMKEKQAVESSRLALKGDIDYHVFVQHLFFQQWLRLKDYACARDVSIIGDIPIYVAMDSADTWADGALFLLDEERRPIEVAGVPPDGFSADGQLWGNPLYRWDVMRSDGYRWWIERISFNLALFDVLRIDHFRGFESYYAVPYGHSTAACGRWRDGPGLDFIGAVNRALSGDARIIAEDLGYLTDGVRALLRGSGYPGMKVLQFAFDSREASDYMPHNYDRHCVVYTGTHDNDTVRGWCTSAPKADVALARAYLGLADDGDAHWAFIRAALGSVADLAVIPIQDYLNLDSSARINVPSTLGGGNWRWRLPADALTDGLQAQILRMTRLYGRKSRSK